MLKSARVFLVQGNYNNERLNNFNIETIETVNEVEETLRTQVFVNEQILERYTHCRVVMDEIFDITGRAFNRNLSQVIVQNPYDVYIDNRNGLLICLCSKKSAERIKVVFEEMLDIQYENHIFDLNTIVYDCSNVKKAQFTNLTIQTLNSGMIKGNRVNDTEIFADMLQNGDLSNIVVTYPFGMQDISISVSASGSLVLYTNLSDDDFVQFIDELIQ
ncbi:hypothetical protein SDC9_118213 [bioreactor metagenome]|uniref:Uncharacterized protein n=1 Tax=bioreactor metagenome TaxID=1076179 RepID=A0A645C0F8_9ZZZZ